MKSVVVKNNAVAVVLEAFAAVETRDDARLAKVAHPDIAFHWPESLRRGGTWESMWDPFQPTRAERAMDPRVVASNDDAVAVIWHQRGVNANGERLDCEVFGLYELRDGLLASAKMFYFDTVAVKRFLETDAPAQRSKSSEAPR